MLVGASPQPVEPSRMGSVVGIHKALQALGVLLLVLGSSRTLLSVAKIPPGASRLIEGFQVLRRAKGGR